MNAIRSSERGQPDQLNRMDLERPDQKWTVSRVAAITEPQSNRIAIRGRIHHQQERGFYGNSVPWVTGARHGDTRGGARPRPTLKEVELKSNVGICRKQCQTIDQRHLLKTEKTTLRDPPRRSRKADSWPLCCNTSVAR
jgi:hypothetical protein